MADRPAARGRTVTIGDRALTLTNLDKVLYPETGTTKGEVIAYYVAVAPWMIPHAKDRPLTRKRWANGVDGPVFFEKNLPGSAPDWIQERVVHHRDHDLHYPLLDDVATLAWVAQQAALELHVPQWRFDPDGVPMHPDRLVLDLDPGEGVGLRECVEVAHAARELLHGAGLDPLPVTSGSKGIHLYAALDGASTAAQVSEVAHELARVLEQDMPDLVLSQMSRAARTGKVFVDWSQNNGNKTTIAPYSLRGRSRPTVAAPRTWEELDDPDLHHLTMTEVLDRLHAIGDPLHAVAAASLAVGRRDHGHWESNREPDGSFRQDEPNRADPTGGATHDRLAAYRSMRDASRTPEPVPQAPPTVRTDGRPTFVIQEHHATRLHYDFRLEHEGVLVSWSLPKGEPDDPGQNHLAVQTEDHPLEYGGFEGTIPHGQYGGGSVTIWDHGTYELEKWREGAEVIATLHGVARGTRRLALLHTGGRGGEDRNWLIHRTKEQPSGTGATDGGTEATGPTGQGDVSRPMLASPATVPGALTPDHWAFEMKWDGVRAIAEVRHGRVRLTSRNGNDLTGQYPELAALADHVGVDAVLDGEIVALDERGRPSFGDLQNRMGRFALFDVLEADGHDLTRVTYEHRREALGTVVDPGGPIDVPPAFDGTLDEAMAESRRRGLEGVVAKRRDSPYSSGRRSEAWVKIKHHATQEVVVGGWKPGTGRRAGGIGSLLLGVPTEDGLAYVGKVGTGFRDRDLDEIAAVLTPLTRPDSPFTDVPRPDARDAHWVEPLRVGEVEFAEWTNGDRLRQPSWRGWRPDKAPGDVTREG
jgi:bifunctional non-homologous end joining protein LigD